MGILTRGPKSSAASAAVAAPQGELRRAIAELMRQLLERLKVPGPLARQSQNFLLRTSDQDLDAIVTEAERIVAELAKVRDRDRVRRAGNGGA